MSWQICPVCKGEEIISKFCSVCNGKKIISELTGLPPVGKPNQVNFEGPTNL
jgi:hypothetical protein